MNPHKMFAFLWQEWEKQPPAWSTIPWDGGWQGRMTISSSNTSNSKNAGETNERVKGCSLFQATLEHIFEHQPTWGTSALTHFAQHIPLNDEHSRTLYTQGIATTLVPSYFVLPTTKLRTQWLEWAETFSTEQQQKIALELAENLAVTWKEPIAGWTNEERISLQHWCTARQNSITKLKLKRTSDWLLHQFVRWVAAFKPPIAWTSQEFQNEATSFQQATEWLMDVNGFALNRNNLEIWFKKEECGKVLQTHSAFAERWAEYGIRYLLNLATQNDNEDSDVQKQMRALMELLHKANGGKARELPPKTVQKLQQWMDGVLLNQAKPNWKVALPLRAYFSTACQEAWNTWSEQPKNRHLKIVWNEWLDQLKKSDDDAWAKQQWQKAVTEGINLFQKNPNFSISEEAFLGPLYNVVCDMVPLTKTEKPAFKNKPEWQMMWPKLQRWANEMNDPATDDFLQSWLTYIHSNISEKTKKIRNKQGKEEAGQLLVQLEQAVLDIGQRSSIQSKRMRL